MTDFDRLVAHFEGMDIAEAVGLAGIQSVAPVAPPPPVRPQATRKRTLGESRRRGLLGRPATRTQEEPTSWTLQDGFTTEDTTMPTDDDLAALNKRLTALEERAAPFDPESAQDLDELAGRLYPYLRSRLRAELIVDRERSGRLADAR